MDSIDAYLTTLPPDQRAVMQQARAVLGAALPEAVETISYQLPTWKVGGRAVVYFAVWKSHAALYPGAADAVTAFADELAPYEQTKGTIRFPLDAVPFDLVRRIAKHREAAIRQLPPTKAAQAAAKKTAAKKTATKKTATKKTAAKKTATKKTAKKT
jgi:uncharacterized protein YdhG (YjbR/CyaY superfamily)